MSKLIIIRGAPGCGKTAVANLLHDSLDKPTVLLPRDTFSVDITKDVEQLRPAMKDVYKHAIRTFVASGAWVICEGAFYSEHWHQSFRSLEEDLGIVAHHFFLQASRQTVLERARARRKADIIDDSYIDNAYAGAKPLGWDSEMIIDTDLKSVRQIGEEIASVLTETLDYTLEKRLFRSDSFQA